MPYARAWSVCPRVNDNSAADDARTIRRLQAQFQNEQNECYHSKFANALSYLQAQDASLSAAGKIVDRMAELRTMSQDITKNSGDIENYSKEFMELQGQLNQIQKEKFNGISLFSTGTGTASGTPTNQLMVVLTSTQMVIPLVTIHLVAPCKLTIQAALDGSVSLNVINFQFMLSIHSTASTTTAAGSQGFNLANIGSVNNTSDEFSSSGYINDIKEVSVGAFIDVIARIADMRAENGAEQNRVMQRLDLLQSNLTNIEAAHGRIMDADIALESTRFARHNILVQASASMTAQANQLSAVALSLIG